MGGLKRELNNEDYIILLRKSINFSLIEKLPKFKVLNNYLKKEEIFL